MSGERSRIAISVTITVLAVLLVAMLAYAATSRGLRHVAQTVASPSPIPGAAQKEPPPLFAPSPPGFHRLLALDLDLLDVATGWVLLTDCLNPAAVCNLSVSTTTDGGVSWTKPAPVSSFNGQNGNAPRTIRFVDDQNGFVYGGSAAYVTHDGGRTWRDAGIKATFFYGFVSGGGLAWAVTYPCSKGTVCPFEVRSSVDGGRTWSHAYQLPPNFDPLDIVGFRNGLVMSKLPPGALLMTTDGGQTWRSINGPCSATTFTTKLATVDGRELWYLCVAFPDTSGNAEKALFVSEDAGETWTRRATSVNGGTLPAFSYPTWFVTNQPGVAFMNPINLTLATRDGGVTWKPIPEAVGGFVVLHFAGRDTGWALDAASSLWETTDGGQTWGQAGPLPVG